VKFKDFFSFERMVTPVIIKILFFIGLVASVVGGIVVFITMLFGGISSGGFGPILGGLFGGLLSGALTIFLGALTIRVYTELLIVIFKINDNLTDIKTLLKKDQTEVSDISD